jgi:tetratricopeptide (TPR) repeat protein
MGTTASNLTRYRILEWSPGTARRPGYEHWSPRGVAYERAGGVFLWLAGWKTSLPLSSSLEDLSERDYPTPDERWRWCSHIRESAGERFWPDKVLVAAITSAEGHCGPGERPSRRVGRGIGPRVETLAAAGFSLTGRRRLASVRGPRLGQVETGAPLALEDVAVENEPAVRRAAATVTLPANIPTRAAPFYKGRVPMLIGICAPVLGEQGEDSPSHPHVDGWREWRRVREVIDKVGDSETSRGVPLRLTRLRPPTLEQLREALHPGRGWPAFPVVHLVGYATPGLLAMEQANGREHLVEPERLASAFRRSEVQMALLNICYGEDFAEALLDVGVAAVVSTLREISDPEATLLARELYLRLAFGDTIHDAYAWAQESIIEAYRRGKLPPLFDYQGQDLEVYGQARAENIILLGDGGVRLPLPPPGEAAARAEFDLSEPPHNLPHPDDVFIGRGRELVLISDWMEEHKHRLIALTGIGGMGKSTLALRAAQRNRWRYHRVIYLTGKDADGCRRPLTLEDVYRRVEAVLGLGGSISCLPTAAARSQRAADILNAHASLLVLDSIEMLSQQEIQDLAEFLQLLQPLSGTMALITSRREHVPPLLNRTRSDHYHLRVNTFEPADSISLLAELLKPPVDRPPTAEEREVWDKVPELSWPPGGRAHFQILAERADVPIERVCALDRLAEAAYRHPLLLCFAAADLKGPGNDWKGVVEGLRNLRGKELQEQVENKIGVMCRDLGERSPAALQLVQTLLVFSQGATREALRFVWCGRQVDDDSQEAQVFDDARRAARRSALLYFKSDRYDLHPLVHQYLTRWLAPDDALNQQRCQAHATFYLEFLRRHHKKHDALEPERLNLLRGMDWAERAGEDRMVVEYARHLFDFLWVRGYWNEGRDRMGRGAAVANRLGDHRSEAHLLFQIGQLCRYQGAYDEARRHFQNCLALEEKLQDLALRANAMLELGILFRYQGEHQQAVEHYQRCLGLEEQIRDRVLRAKVLHELGVLHGVQGNYEEARRYSLDSLALEEELEDKTLKASTLQQLSVQYWAQGDYAKAREYCEQAIQLAVELDNQILKARLYSEYGVLKSKQGELPEAREYLQRGLELREQLGDRTGQAATLCFLGELSLGEGNRDAAEELYRRSLELADQLASPYWRAWNLFGLGLCATARDQRDLARQRFEEALALAERIQIPLATQVRTALEQLEKEA